jgi:NADH-quinone oxidoreductase subunit N
LSLGGIPPTVGFWGKYQLFSAAVGVGEIGLAVVGVMLSAVGLYYYLRIVVAVYMGETVAGEREREGGVEDGGPAGAGQWSPLAVAAMTAPAAGVLLFGIFPGVLMDALVLGRM